MGHRPSTLARRGAPGPVTTDGRGGHSDGRSERLTKKGTGVTDSVFLSFKEVGPTCNLTNPIDVNSGGGNVQCNNNNDSWVSKDFSNDRRESFLVPTILSSANNQPRSTS